MASPRIGISTSTLREPGYYGAYFRAVEAAGGEPVALEAGTEEGDHAATVLAGVDGLLLPGGWDVDPQLYGEAPAAPSDPVDRVLDRSEVALIRTAVREHVPVFGICRGQQIINVALGGSLHQHVEEHDMHGQARSRLAHVIAVTQPSELADAVGADSIEVNSLHHQAVKAVAPPLRVTALSPDGTVEGVESADRLVVGVQCHPEELIHEREWALSLLRRFVDRAAARSAG